MHLSDFSSDMDVEMSIGKSCLLKVLFGRRDKTVVFKCFVADCIHGNEGISIFLLGL